MEDMNILYITQKQKIPLADGGEIAYIATFPEYESLPKMSAFYKKAEESCRRFCAEELPSLLPRPTDQYRYRLSCNAVCEEERLTVTLSVTLTNRTSRQILERHEETHTWKDDVMRKRISNK